MRELSKVLYNDKTACNHDAEFLVLNIMLCKIVAIDWL